MADFPASLAFYKAVFPVLGITLLYGDNATYAGFGVAPEAFFWINASGTPGTGTHIAFTTRDRDTVDTFYRTALAAGARDNGAPGLRPHYHPDYYGAFVFDPDGYNLEAVCHAP
ncbi:VOC family protein [Acidocella sp.]|uniref:VOC family protein n=1 Tax=Acidocella sp. TaxID=50710 RepID=UPI003CFC89FB